MPTKAKPRKATTKVRNIPKKLKELTARDQKKIKGGKTYQVANFNFKVGGLP